MTKQERSEEACANIRAKIAERGWSDKIEAEVQQALNLVSPPVRRKVALNAFIIFLAVLGLSMFIAASLLMSTPPSPPPQQPQPGAPQMR